MQGNQSTFDRIIRVVSGILILGLGLILHSAWGVLGIIPLGTGVAGFCPLYRLFGVSTGDGRAHHT